MRAGRTLARGSYGPVVRPVSDARSLKITRRGAAGGALRLRPGGRPFLPCHEPGDASNLGRRDHHELPLRPDAEFELPGDPPVAVQLAPGHGRVVTRGVVQDHAGRRALVVPPDPGPARSALHDDGDAVELFVAGVEDVAGHRKGTRELGSLGARERASPSYLAP